MNNLDTKIINDTKEFWQQYYEDEILTDDAAIEIHYNLVSFAKLLIKGSRYIKQKRRQP